MDQNYSTSAWQRERTESRSHVNVKVYTVVVEIDHSVPWKRLAEEFYWARMKEMHGRQRVLENLEQSETGTGLFLFWSRRME